MARTPRIAPKVFERDGYRCQYCCAELGDVGVELGIDHVVPVSWYLRGVVAGDMNVAGNLVCCCFDCNSYKRDMNLEIYAEYLRLGHGWTATQVNEMLARVRAALRRRLPR